MDENQRIKTHPLNVVFRPESCEYHILHSFKSMNLIYKKIDRNKIGDRDPLINIRDSFMNIKFTSIKNIIDYCRNEGYFSLENVFEWVNFFIKVIFESNQG